MLKQLFNVPRARQFVLACSGGVDSMAVADFFHRGGKKFVLAYFDHGTGNKEHAVPVIEKFAQARGLDVMVGKLSSPKPQGLSPEEHWRNERYRWLISFDKPIVTCHHLGDVVEGWIFSSLHGNPKLMRANTVINSYGKNSILWRPFLTNTKDDLRNWCLSHNVNWYEDETNADTKYPRNFIRHQLLPDCLTINPGLFKTIKKKILTQETNNGI